MAPSSSVEQRVYQGIRYKLVRTRRRKTAAILIAPGGDVTVRVPQELDDGTIHGLLDKQHDRLMQAVSKQAGLPEPVVRSFDEGCTFPFLGQEHRLHFDTGASEELTLGSDGFHLRYREGVDAEATYQAAFRKFYTDHGRTYLAGRVHHFAPAVGVLPTATRVLHLGNRWGSCSPKGAVNFHWRAMMAPPKVVDYLVVHELAHLKQPDHSREFWRLVEQVIADHELCHEWLRAHGAEMDL
ncbi:MAG: M48 family metallopeptidase [Alphaproteobacteria bacterium]|nr:M48 family metallopeptidase [Alphaproteobacteria bacterium]